MRRVLALAIVGALTFAAPAWADREHSNNNTSKKLRQAVTVSGILEHEAAFQGISDFNGGNRLSGTPGYDASADYVAERAAAAGLEVSRFDFDYELDLLADFSRAGSGRGRGRSGAQLRARHRGSPLRRRLRHDVLVSVR